MKKKPTERETPEILIPALRQYRNNDGSGLTFGFDYEETIKIVEKLQQFNRSER